MGHPSGSEWDREVKSLGHPPGIHFRPAEIAGRQLGRLVAAEVWTKAQRYFDGTAGNQGLAAALTPVP